MPPWSSGKTSGIRIIYILKCVSVCQKYTLAWVVGYATQAQGQ